MKLWHDAFFHFTTCMLLFETSTPIFHLAFSTRGQRWK